MYAIEVLETEHENVRRLCGTMRKACLAAMKDKAVRPEDFRRFLHIIREYADRHHHGKEELLLFKEMESQLGHAAQQLVRNGMLVEHDLGRLYARQMEEAVDRYEESYDMESLLDIIANAMAYADLLVRHLERENQVVYPYAEKNLPAGVLSVLDNKTREYEQTAEESGVIASILTDLADLEKSYAVGERG